jgi:GH24 family phage-related lysozyme (muramidase)
MKTVKLVEWLGNQGMVDASTQFSNTFEGIENVEYASIEGFLTQYYGEYTDDVFRHIQCDVVTTLW